jgi:hypothetical protein
MAAIEETLIIAPARRSSMYGRMFAGKTTREIEIDGAMPSRLIELNRPAHCRVTHIVVKYVDTSMLRDDIRYDLSDSLGVGHITGVRCRRAPFSMDDIHCFLGGIPVDVDAPHLSIAREQHGRRLVAQPRTDGTGAEQDCDLILKTFRHGCSAGSWTVALTLDGHN